MQRLGSWIGLGAMGFSAALFIAFGFWAATFRLWIAAVLALAFALACVPVLWRNKWVWVGRGVAVGALIALSVVGVKPGARQLGRQLEQLAGQYERGGASALSTRDRAGLWGLHVVMAAGGYAWGLPEVSREAWRLNLPGRKTRVWFSDFPMRSPRVRAALLEIVDDEIIRSQETSHSTQVTWPDYKETARTDSLRVALALNCPLVLDVEAIPHGPEHALNVVARCQVSYPRRGPIPIAVIDGQPIVLEEGLFHALEETGWMFPYTAEWHFQVRTDNPRLRDTEPVLGWRERTLRDWWLTDDASP